MDSDDKEVVYCADDDECEVYCKVCDEHCFERF